MKDWQTLAEDINKWATDNFGATEPWKLMYGVLEEIGEFIEARDRNDRDAVMDSLGDQAVFALNLCKTLGLPTFPDDGAYPEGWDSTITTNELLKAIGTGSKGLLKHSQGIRGMDGVRMREHITFFVQTWHRWASQQVLLYAMPTLLEITNDVWDRVSTRDWKANPITGSASEKHNG